MGAIVGRQSLRLLATLVVVAAGYYAGSLLGFQLKFPDTMPSVLWPPNAILTAALLLTRPRRWWLYLLAAFSAHLAVQLPRWPLTLVTALYATNCSEALLAAGAVHWFSDRPTRFDTLRRVSIFVIGGAVMAPFISSFLDAAVVTGLHGQPYWNVWRTRFFANVLTELTVVPTIVMIVTAGTSWWRGLPLRRLLEAGLLAFGLSMVAFLAFGRHPDGPAGILGAPGTPLALLFPFLLWSALRFGPGGVSVCLLATTLMAIWAATRHQGLLPFPADGVIALQLFLSVTGFPLMCLAGAIEERKQANDALEERLRFEELLARLSADFVHLSSEETDRTFETWLGRLGEHLRVDGVVLIDFAAATDQTVTLRSWTASGLGSGRMTFAIADFPWAIARLRGEQTLVFAGPDDLPPEATHERALLRQHGVKTGIVLPLEAGGRVLGGFAFIAFTVEPGWAARLVGRLRLVGEVFAGSLARRETEDALRASEGMKSAILASMTSGVAVVDREGRIVTVNESWARRAAEIGTGSSEGAGIGDDLLAVWRRQGQVEASPARETVTGIEAVLEHRRQGFAFEYTRHGSGAERWFAMSVVPLNSVEGGAVISHTDVTDWKRAEHDAQRSREELAHFTRVSTMGALAASLAHELNQPLAGILSNAQAARRFLDVIPPDLDELRAILDDIVDDDKRAGEVIDRLRELLRKGDFHAVRLDLNALIRDVVKLLASDALIRGMRIHLVPPAGACMVNGDRIQLQQVMLNLLVNAMEAMADVPRDERIVTVDIIPGDAGMVRVSVRDGGIGFESAKLDLIFEPFYTTKASGMGMGLSISRSIVEAHGGSLWATNNPAGGATFDFTLPLAGEAPG